jgi:hypothetical protein
MQGDTTLAKSYSFDQLEVSELDIRMHVLHPTLQAYCHPAYHYYWKYSYGCFARRILAY